MRTLGDLFEGSTVIIPAQWKQVLVSGIAFNSKNVKRNSLFVAIKGSRFDGHDFIQEAVSKGAKVIIGEIENTSLLSLLSERGILYISTENSREILSHLAATWFGRPSRFLRVIGVTGSKGKTSVVHMTWQLLRNLGISVAFWSSVAAYDGKKYINRETFFTTPDPLTLQGFLHEAVNNGVQIAIIEVTSHGIDQFRVHDIDFDVAVLTNLEPEHLEYHGTFEAYVQAKRRLFQYACRTHYKGRKNFLPFRPIATAVINKEAPESELFYSTCSDTLTFSWADCSAFICVERSVYDVEDFTIRTNLRVDAEKIFLQIKNAAGDFNVYNALATLGIAKALGLKLPSSLSLDAFVEGRFVRVVHNRGFSLFYDYAHTPRSLEESLKAARRFVKKGGRLLVLFGISGRRDRWKRALMGEVVASFADKAVATAMDWFPEEHIRYILQDIAKGLQIRGWHLGKDFWLIEDREEAIKFILEMARPRDVVLIVGKGHERVIVKKGQNFLWDEYAIIEKYVA